MLSFHVKFVQTDRWTTVKQNAPDLSIQGHRKNIMEVPKLQQKSLHLQMALSSNKRAKMALDRSPDFLRLL